MSHRIIDLPAAAAHRQKPRLADETVERRQRRQSNMDLLRARVTVRKGWKNSFQFGESRFLVGGQ